MNRTLTQLLLLMFIFTHVNVYAEVNFKISGLDIEQETNVKIYLSALDTPKDLQDERFLSQVIKSAQSALSVFGYYQASVQITLTGKIPEQSINLVINAGPQTYINESNIQIVGEGKKSEYFITLRDSFLLSKGMVLQHRNYESAKTSLKNLARRYGYFDATFEQAKVEVTSKKNSASVYLLFDTGPRYQFGKLIFSAELPADRFVTSLKNFNIGDAFDTKALSEFNIDLSETGYFKNISILPDFSKKDGLMVPLHVIATMHPQYSFNAGLGYSTDEGIRGTFRWRRPWVNQYGHSMEGNIVASVAKQETSLTYKVPLEDPLYNYLSVQAGYKMLDQNDTDTSQYLLSVNRHWRLDNGWKRTLFLRYDHEDGIQGAQEFDNELILPGISYSRTRTRGGINTTWGDKLLGSLEVSNQWWFSSDDMIKAYGQAKIIRSYSSHQLIASTELGLIQTDSIYNVPSSMRFFTGGDQSIRGFDYESIAPHDSQGYLVGGKYLAVLNLEYRFSVLQNWKLALFTDMGTATDDFSEVISSSAGIGAVWASPVGPIRLYIAKPVTNEINSFAIHFMIGPEL